MKRQVSRGVLVALVALAAMVVVFLMAIAAFATTLILQQRRSAVDISAAQADRFVNGAVSALNRSLLDVDVMLSSVDEFHRLSMIDKDTLDRPAIDQTLQMMAKNNLMLNRLVLLDSQSVVLASSQPRDRSALTVPPEFVRHTLDATMSTLAISAPELDATTSSRVIFLARRLKLTNGELLLMVAEVPMMEFNTIVMQGADIAGLEVSLERSNGELLVSAPVQDKLLGQVMPSPISRPISPAQHMPARLTGADALVVAQSLLYDDVLIVASIPMQAVLLKWNGERNFILWVAALFALMVLAAGGFGAWYLDRLAQARWDSHQSKVEIEELAFHDHLTHLPNRLLFMDRLGHALSISERDRHTGAVLFLDLDNFKNINDTLGHDVGDLVLKQVAQRLTDNVRQVDTVARFGGDEFVVLLENFSGNSLQAAESARRLGDKVLSALSQPYTSDKDGQWLNSSASIGATLFGSPCLPAAELLKQADIAMYQAKALGRNKLCFFDPQMQATINAHAQLESDLRMALQHQEFQLYFQPQVTQGHRVTGAEVLIRWQHPERGMVPPLEFIAVAEESDLINQIGLWVLRTACQQLRLWQQSPDTAGLQLAVNVSARQFRQPDFVEQVHQVVSESGIKASGLKLELTESLVLVNVDDTIAKMVALKTLGLSFAMDDFGTGQSSLSYLTKLPLDQLKIDQSFVRNIGIKPSDGMIVQTIIGMARNLGLEVIAEGVETLAQQTFLAEHGCSLYQGYFYGKPTPLSGFQALMASRRILA